MIIHARNVIHLRSDYSCLSVSNVKAGTKRLQAGRVD